MGKDNLHRKQLKDIEKKQMFQAPEGYFEQLPDIILQRIASEEKTRSTSAKIISFNRFWLAVAASVVLIVALYFTVSIRESKQTDYYAMLNEVSSDEIVAYLGETDISIAELESALANDEQIYLYDGISIPELDEEEDAEALLEYYSL